MTSIGVDLRAILILLSICFLPGYGIWMVAGHQLRNRISAAEAVFLMLVTSIAAVSWFGLFTAELERFSLGLLLTFVLAISAFPLVWALRVARRANRLQQSVANAPPLNSKNRPATVRSLRRSQVEKLYPKSANPFSGMRSGKSALLVLTAIGITLTLAPRPYKYIVGGRDHGIYVNTGVHIAKSGGILIHDAALAEVPAESRQSLIWPKVSIDTAGYPGPWSMGQRLSGFTIRNLDQGIIAPHAFHLYPVWIAIFYSVGGLPFALATTTVFSILGTVGFFLAGIRLVGRSPALIAILLLAINVTQLWFTQYPSAEIMVRFFLWSGLFSFTLMLKNRSRYAAVLAGLAFGLLHLTKLDTVFVPVVLLLYFLYLWLTKRFRAHHWFFVLPYLVLSVHASIHAFFVSTIYFIDHAVRVLLPAVFAAALVRAANGLQEPSHILTRLFVQNWGLLFAGIAGLCGLVFLGLRYNQLIAAGLRRVEQQARTGKGFLALSVALVVTVATLAFAGTQARWMTTALRSLYSTSWYLTPAGLILGIIGMLHVWMTHIRNGSSRSLTFAWLFLSGNMLPLFVLGEGTAPDHFWAVRRYVPVVIPAMLLFGSYLLWSLFQRRQNWGSALLPTGMLLALIVASWQNTRPAIGVTEYDGLVDQVATLANRFPPEAVLLFERSDAAGRVATPLWIIFDMTAFAVENDAIGDESLEAAIESWQLTGREVFWISTSGTNLPASSTIGTDYLATAEIAVPLFEAPTNRIPSTLGSYRAAYDIYRVVPESEVTRQVLTFSALGSIEGEQMISGLHAPTFLPGLTPRRWSGNQIELKMPLIGHPEKLLLRLENGRPVGVSAPVVNAFLHDTHLGAIDVLGETNIYELVVPANLDFRDDSSDLRLQIDSWIPAQTGHGADQRELGVQLDWIKLVMGQ